MEWKRTSAKNLKAEFGNQVLIARYELLDTNNVPNGFAFILQEPDWFWAIHYIQGNRTTMSKCPNIRDAVRFAKQLP